MRKIVALCCLLTALVTAGCASPSGPEGSNPTQPSSTGSPPTQTSTELLPLTELDVLSNPRNYYGASTAVLQNAAIEPITDKAEPQLPVTITDGQGTEVTVDDVSRILALDMYGSLSATIWGLGLGENLIGRDTSSSFPGVEDLPLVTQNGHQLSGEAVLDLAPTVIITDTSIGPWDTILQLRESGIPVVIVDSHRNMDNVDDLILQVAAALGVEAEGEALADRVGGEIDAKIAEIAALTPTAEEDKVRVMFLYVRGNAGIYYMFGKESGADSLIQALGAIDIATEIDWQGMRPMNAEALVAMQPDLILMMTKGLESVDGVEGLLERVPAVANTPAGVNRRIVDMGDTEILSFGPRTPEVLDALARAIYAPEG